MQPRAITAAVRRELDARFQVQNNMLEQIMNRLNATEQPVPNPPAQQDPHQGHAPPAVEIQAPIVPQKVPRVGEPIYERFRRQKPDGGHKENSKGRRNYATRL